VQRKGDDRVYVDFRESAKLIRELGGIITVLVNELKECNALIATTEERFLPQHRKSIEAQLAEKNRELDAHTQTRPQEVQKPDADPTAQQQSRAATEQLEQKQTELKALEAELAALRATDATAAKKRSTAEKLIGKLKNLERHVETFLAEAKADFDELNVAASDIVISMLLASISQASTGKISHGWRSGFLCDVPPTSEMARKRKASTTSSAR
jgi:DNA repair exonuclease SbcCD ATPase subunit